MSLRISTGRSSLASVSRSPALKAKGASPSGSPFRSSARTTPLSLPSVARRTFTVSAPAALSAAASARAGSMPPSTTVIGALPGNPLEALDELRRLADIDAVGEPDQLDAGRGVEETLDRRQRLDALDAVRLRPDLLEPHARGAGRLQRDVAAGLRQRHDRDAASCPPRRARSVRPRCARARPRSRRRPSRRRSAARAARCPTTPRSAGSTAGRRPRGSAAPRASGAAARSHHGVRAGVSSFGRMSSSSFSEPYCWRRGRGGISRSSHHSTGRLSRPSSTSGSAKPSGRPIMPASRLARACASG